MEEHAAVIDAIADRNDRMAVEAMGLHIGRMIEEIEERDMLDPTLFLDDRQGATLWQSRAAGTAS